MLEKIPPRNKSWHREATKRVCEARSKNSEHLSLWPHGNAEASALMVPSHLAAMDTLDQVLAPLDRSVSMLPLSIQVSRDFLDVFQIHRLLHYIESIPVVDLSRIIDPSHPLLLMMRDLIYCLLKVQCFCDGRCGFHTVAFFSGTCFSVMNIMTVLDHALKFETEESP
jgi:hypothetical protein